MRKGKCLNIVLPGLRLEIPVTPLTLFLLSGVLSLNQSRLMVLILPRWEERGGDLLVTHLGGPSFVNLVPTMTQSSVSGCPRVYGNDYVSQGSSSGDKKSG